MELFVNLFSELSEESEAIKLRKLEIYDLIFQAVAMLAERTIKLEIIHFAVDSFRK